VSDRSWLARARRAGSDALSRLDAARPRFRALDAGWDLWERDRGKAATLLAGALVYRLFVWLLPVTLLVASGLGFLADSDPQAPEDLAHDSGVGGYMVGVVGDAADQARDSRWYTLALALVGMALAGSGAVRALRLSHAVVWEVQLPKMRRAWLATLALLGVTLLAGGLAALSWKARAVNPGVGLAGVVGTTLAFAAVWLLASWLLPHADAPW
jgi:uncharacterized BrkB/YihY/UPF0761 family membrane protein